MLKKTKTTGQTCVGDLRLTSLDVGYDPRVSGLLIRLPSRFASAGIEVDGETFLIEGTRDEMVAEITAAGYRIA